MSSLLVKVLWTSKQVVCACENPHEIALVQQHHKSKHPETVYFVSSVDLPLTRTETVVMHSEDGNTLTTNSDIIREKLIPTEMD